MMGKLDEEMKGHLPAYLQIAVLGRPPKENELQFLEKFKSLGQDYQKNCEEFNYEQGIVRDY